MSIEPFMKCSNVADSVVFYTDVLDFRIKVAPDPDPNAFMSKYALIEREGDLVHLSAHDGDGVFGNLIYVRVPNVEELYRRYLAKGLRAVEGDSGAGVRIELVEQTWGMKEFGIYDPDRNKITFGQRI